MHDLEVTGIHTGLPPGAGEGPRYVGQPELDFTFGDFLDIINPLQHIPLVSNLYREITGDEISPHARILGGTLFGGASGFLGAVANVFYEEVAGEDVGETVMALFTGDDVTDEPQFAEDDGIVMPAAAFDAETLPAPLETAAAPGAAPAAAPAADAEAVLPEAAPGMLTGQEALDALFMDLSGGSQAPPAMPLAGAERQPMPLPDRQGAAPAKSYALPPRHIRVGPAAPEPVTAAPTAPPAVPSAQPPAAGDDAVHPLLFAQEAGEGALADRMMQALDKYQAMSQQRNRPASDEDKPAWKADPTLVPASGS